MIMDDVQLSIDHLTKWMKPQPVKKDWINTLLFNGVYLKPEPYGVALISGAWNYPFMTCLVPLVGAVAAGE